MAQKDPTTPWTPPSDAILVEEKSTWTPPSDAILIDPTPEKKNVVGASQPSLFPGLGGSSPLSASATPPKTTFGEGALEAARTPEPKKQIPVPPKPIEGLGKQEAVS